MPTVSAQPPYGFWFAPAADGPGLRGWDWELGLASLAHAPVTLPIVLVGLDRGALGPVLWGLASAFIAAGFGWRLRFAGGTVTAATTWWYLPLSSLDLGPAPPVAIASAGPDDDRSYYVIVGGEGELSLACGSAARADALAAAVTALLTDAHPRRDRG